MDNNVKKKYDQYSAAYKDTSGVVNQRNNLLSLGNNAPAYTDSYANQINDLYGKIKTGANFNYDPKNDAAFRQYADEYRALSGLAIEGNHAQAQGLTGGYGSTYAPEVARQGLARLNAGVYNAQPAFYQQAQNAYMAQQDALGDAYNAAANMRNNELEQYAQMSDAYNNRYNLAAKQYEDERDLAYKQYADTRDYWGERYTNELKQEQADKELVLSSYDTYNKLASTKCADYAKAGDNKGMKAYLNGLVKEGKITQYMADNLYKQYEVKASGGSGGSGGGRRSSGRSSGYYSSGAPEAETKNGTVTVVNNQGQVVGTYDSGCANSYTVSTNMLQGIGMNRTNTGRANAIDRLEKDDDLKIWLASYFKL